MIFSKANKRSVNHAMNMHDQMKSLSDESLISRKSYSDKTEAVLLKYVIIHFALSPCQGEKKLRNTKCKLSVTITTYFGIRKVSKCVSILRLFCLQLVEMLYLHMLY